MAYFTYYEGATLETSQLELHTASPEEDRNIREELSVKLLNALGENPELWTHEEVRMMTAKVNADARFPLSVSSALNIGLDRRTLGFSMMVVEPKYGLEVYAANPTAYKLLLMDFSDLTGDEEYRQDVYEASRLSEHELSLNAIACQTRPVERVSNLGYKVLELETYLSVGAVDDTLTYQPFATALNPDHPAHPKM